MKTQNNNGTTAAKVNNNESNNRVNNVAMPAGEFGDLCYDYFGKSSVIVFGNTADHAAQLEAMGGKYSDRLRYSALQNGRKWTEKQGRTRGYYFTTEESKGEAIQYVQRVNHAIFDRYEQSTKGGEHLKQKPADFKAGDRVRTIHGLGTVTEHTPKYNAAQSVCVKLDKFTYNYGWKGMPQTFIECRCDEITRYSASEKSETAAAVFASTATDKERAAAPEKWMERAPILENITFRIAAPWNTWLCPYFGARDVWAAHCKEAYKDNADKLEEWALTAHLGDTASFDGLTLTVWERDRHSLGGPDGFAPIYDHENAKESNDNWNNGRRVLVPVLVDYEGRRRFVFNFTEKFTERRGGGFYDIELNDSRRNLADYFHQLNENDGKYFAFYSADWSTFWSKQKKKDLFVFLEWIAANGYTFDMERTDFSISDGYTDFSGNLNEYSAAFFFRIYDDELAADLMAKHPDIPRNDYTKNTATLEQAGEIIAAHEEQKREFGQAFDAEYYKPIIEAIKGRKVFHFGIPADTVRIEVRRECEGYYRIRMKRDASEYVETMSEYIDWETILNTDRAARLLSDLRADHTRAHRFKLGDMVRVSDREFGQTFGHVGRITKVYLINQLVGTRYTVEFVGDLPKYRDGQPMKENDFEPLDIEPVAA